VITIDQELDVEELSNLNLACYFIKELKAVKNGHNLRKVPAGTMRRNRLVARHGSKHILTPLGEQLLEAIEKEGG
jgi:hypothetical protein